MRGLINKFFNIRSHETGMVILVSLFAFFTGSFIATYDIGAHLMFLNYYNPGNLPLAFIISGAGGIVFFILYTFLSVRTSLKIMVSVLMILLTGTVLSTYYYSEFISASSGAIIAYLCFFPLSVISWQMPVNMNRYIFSSEQRKRVHYLIQASFIGGITAGAYAVILFLFNFNYTVIFLISVIISVGLLAFLVTINIYHRLSKHFRSFRKKPVPIKSGLFLVFTSKYTIYLLLFSLLSAIIAFMIHYSFISLTRANYPNIIGMGKFLGLFIGTMYIFIFGMEYILIRRLLYSYDSPYSLVLIPAGTMLVVLTTVIIYFTLGQSTAIARFTFFFMLIGITKISYETMKFTIQHPSLKVLFKNLDIRYRQSIEPRINGIAVMTGLSLAGVILYGLTRLSFIRAIHISAVTIIFIVIWFFTSIKLIKMYRSSLITSIRKLKVSGKSEWHNIKTDKEKIKHLLNSGSKSKIINALGIAEEIEPVSYEKYLISILSNSVEDVHSYVIQKIKEHKVLQALPVVRSKINDLKDEQQKNEYEYLIRHFENKISAARENEQMIRLLNSKNVKERIAAAEVIGAFRKTEFSNSLINLVRDFEPGVKETAIKAIAQLGVKEHTHMLIGYLSSPTYYTHAYEALISIGDDTLNYLEQVFQSPDADNLLLSRIVRIYGRIGSNRATDLLLEKIENQTKEISRQSLQALVESKYQAGSLNINRILNALIKEIAIVVWNLSALQSVVRNKKLILLSNALRSEINSNYQTIYQLLSLAYNANTINSIKEKISKGDRIDISYSVEMLDHFIYEDLKQVLFPLLEDLTDKERIKQLQYYFPLEKHSTAELLPSIITRNFNTISLYTKACTLISMQKLKYKEVGDELVANLFGPHKLLRETAAQVIHNMDPEFIDKLNHRLEPGIQTEIQYTLQHTHSIYPMLLVDKIHFLKSIRELENINEDSLLNIAEKLYANEFHEGKTMTFIPGTNDLSFICIYKGKLVLDSDKDNSLTFAQNEIICPQLLFNKQNGDSTVQLTAAEHTVFFSIQKDTFKELLFDNKEFTNLILDMANNSPPDKADRQIKNRDDEF